MTNKDRISEKIETLLAKAKNELENNPRKSLKLFRSVLDLADSGYLKKEKASVKFHIGLAESRLKLHDKAMGSFREAMDLFKATGDQKGAASAGNRLGIEFESTGRLTDAIQAYNASFYNIDSDDIEPIYSEISMNIGRALAKSGSYDQSLEHLNRAARGYERSGDRSNIGRVNLNIGNIYYQLGSYKAALEHHKIALKIAEDLGNRLEISKSLNNIGADYETLGQLDKALEFHHRALEIQAELSDEVEIVSSLNNIGSAYQSGGNFKEALKYFLEALERSGNISDEYPQAILLNNIGTIYIELGKNKLAYSYLAEGLKKADKLGIDDLRKDSFQSLAKYYFQTGKFKSAYEFLDKYSEIQKSIFSRQITRNLAEYQANLRIEKQLMENARLKEKLIIQNRELLSLAEQVAQKNEFIEKLESVSDSPVNEKRRRAGPDDNLRRARELLDVKADWVTLKARFEEVHSGFVDKLVNEYPGLTRQEIKICMLIRISMTTPMIAKTLYISQRTVENHRHRLRKKLGIPQEVDLSYFLNSLK